MFGWKTLGPTWLTGDVFRVLELLKEARIPSRMPSDNMYFCNLFCPPHPGHRWEIQVRRRDWRRAVDLLDREGLLNRSKLGKCKPGYGDKSRELDKARAEKMPTESLV